MPNGTPTRIRYAGQDGGFYKAVLERVDRYFVETGTSRYANAEMVLQGIASAAIAATAYALILFGGFSWPSSLLLWAALGYGLLLILVNVAHDASHGAWSRSRRVNAILTRAFDLMGFSSYVWHFNHLRSHHGSPNVGHHDAAIAANPVIRMHPAHPATRIQRYQHLYFPLVYGLASVQKWLVLDFATLARGFVGAVELPRTPRRELAGLIATKLLAFVVFLLVPLAVVDAPWWAVLLGFSVMHLSAGTAVGIIFQITHLSEITDFVEAAPDGRIERSFAEHILHTTSDYARTSRIANFLTGGLNVHVTHHLFPGVAHVHVRALSEIVRDTAREFGLPYHEHATTLDALASHVRVLRELGDPDRALRPKRCLGSLIRERWFPTPAGP